MTSLSRFIARNLMSRIPVIFGTILIAPLSFAAISPPGASILRQANALLHEGNYLAFRILIKKAYPIPLTYGDWYGLLGLVNSNVDKAGFDLVYLWNARNPQGKSNFDKTLEYADSLMVAGSYGAAFDESQKMAAYLKKQLTYLRGIPNSPVVDEQIRRIEVLQPHVLHSMGRALYGSGRYADALLVYRRILPGYPLFRQVLFERMWAAFRAGRVEEALGAVASQRSVYFSRFLSPEAYLIQTYIYKKLCRQEDLDMVTVEMKQFEQALNRNEAVADWAGNELETRVLWNLTLQDIRVPESFGITAAEIKAERDGIKALINRAFGRAKARIVHDLKTVMAYSHLAEVTQAGTVLQPIEQLSSRQQLLAQDLEIWPVDKTEEWADEIGSRFFIGDSQCAKSAH